MPKQRPLKGIHMEDLFEEIDKVEAQLRQVSVKLASPELDFAASVRLSVHQRELEGYLRGLLFVIGEPA